MDIPLEWSILIVAGWLATAPLSQNFGNQFSQISIMRGTNDYHGIMALILVIGYGIVCIYNIRLKDKTKKIPVLWILAIGILVQFGWEFVLNITGIRNQSLQTLIVNFCLKPIGIAVSLFYPSPFTKEEMRRYKTIA